MLGQILTAAAPGAITPDDCGSSLPSGLVVHHIPGRYRARLYEDWIETHYETNEALKSLEWAVSELTEVHAKYAAWLDRELAKELDTPEQAALVEKLDAINCIEVYTLRGCREFIAAVMLEAEKLVLPDSPNGVPVSVEIQATYQPLTPPPAPQREDFESEQEWQEWQAWKEQQAQDRRKRDAEWAEYCARIPLSEKWAAAHVRVEDEAELLYACLKDLRIYHTRYRVWLADEREKGIDTPEQQALEAKLEAVEAIDLDDLFANLDVIFDELSAAEDLDLPEDPSQ